MSGNLSLFNRALFVGSFVLAGLAVWEKVLNLVGFTMLRGYTPSHLLDVAGIALLFVIAIQLREIKHLQMPGSGGKASG